MPNVQVPPFSKEFQFELLANSLRTASNRGSLSAAVIEKYCAGRIGDCANLFSITKSEYLDWARAQPISNFVSTCESTFDGDYLIEQGGEWILFTQERGMETWKKSFPNREEASEFAIRYLAPFRLYEGLRD